MTPTHAEITATLRAAGCVFAEDEASILLATGADDVASLVARRVAGEPLEVVVGWAEFCGLRIEIDPGVFVPRRRTELLVREAARLAPSRRAVVVDLCCGSGALGVALAHLVPVELYAADIEPAAVRCARRNVGTVGGEVFEGDLDQPLPAALRGRVDLLVANVPYVPTDAIGTMPPEARLHEPLVTADGGPDGLDVLRRVAAVAPRWLRPGGHLLVETSEAQVPAASAAFEDAGLSVRVVSDDETGGTTLVGTLGVA
ncbi:putative protein N(5)-glutamine methyltransferase [Cellulomonas sp. P5_C6]